MADFKLDIFQVLGKLDAGKYDVYGKRPEPLAPMKESENLLGDLKGEDGN